ncbi:MAG: hypothetical protein BA863_18525 [Desulfovibrio sp. S3730MH75]|nr:MAG: hypothetical protein BA863_18525 [Desulfovibrio sp. S3730MH75]
MIDLIYTKYRAYRLEQEKKRIGVKTERFLPLFQPTGPFHFNELASHMEEMGVKSSDNILLRFSAQVAPFLEGGLTGFYKDFFDYVDSGAGNLFSLSYSFDRSPLMYFGQNEVFDPEYTPTTIGLCNEIFRRMDGVVRSLHPTHSVSVYGGDKDRIIAEHHLNPHTYSLQSPFAHLYELGSGKEVIIGLNHSSTGQHFIEDKFSITGKISKPVISLLNIDGTVREIPFYVDNPFVKYIGYFKTDPFKKLLMDKGILKESKINGITIYVHDCNKFYQEMPAVYASDNGPFKRLYLKTFVLNKIVHPLILKVFFEEREGVLFPKKKD